MPDTIKIWQVTKHYLNRLTAYRQIDDPGLRFYTNTLTDEISMVYKRMEQGDYRLNIANMPKNTKQTSVRIGGEAYEQLYRIQAYLMLDRGKQYSLQRIIHSIVQESLSDYE